MSGGVALTDGVLGLATRAAHAGSGHLGGPDGLPVPVLGPAGESSHGLPLYQSTNFTYPDARTADRAAAGDAYLYARHGSPTVEALEHALADLEGGEAAVAFGSGMAAVAAVTFALAGRGDEVLASEGIYGGSTELLRDLGSRLGLEARFVPAWNTDEVRAMLDSRTRVLLIETVTNPLLRVADLPALARLSARQGTALVVDSTFTSPVLCQPLALGASVVVHSLSKFIGGHGDLLGGVAVGRTVVMNRVRRFRTLVGSVLDPFCAWLAVRGLRTLPVRMERQVATAFRLARLLETLPGVRAVSYPGLNSHPDHGRARRLLQAPGAVVSFELHDGASARRFYDRVQVIGRAASLGEVSSLLTHPASFSHKGLAREDRERLGIREGLLRLSVGLEDARDLEQDIRQALAGARQAPARRRRAAIRSASAGTPARRNS